MLFAVLALGMGLQVGVADSSGPTLLEQALAAHRCGGARAAAAQETDAHQECLRNQLLALRTDFGRDLSRVSSAERTSIDSVCRKFNAALERDAYVECLSGQLTALRNRRNRTSAAPSAPVKPSVNVPSASPVAPAQQAPSPSVRVWIGATLGILLVVTGSVLLALKARRSRRKCRVCGQDVPDAGDLCQKCRHEAAEALRSAATKRGDHERALQEEPRRQRERDDEQKRLRARQEEDERLRQQEQARQEGDTRREEELRRREEEDRERRHVGATEEGEESNPYEILGVRPDASQEAIHAAYVEAKLKFAPELVADMGAELQEHFKAKAAAVERAYQHLTVHLA